jgi:hypothetical protein
LSIWLTAWNRLSVQRRSIAYDEVLLEVEEKIADALLSMGKSDAEVEGYFETVRKTAIQFKGETDLV